MKIKKNKNSNGSYDFTFTKDDKRLKIEFGGNLDLYFILGTNRNIGLEDLDLSMDITKEDYELYAAIDTLYNEIISGDVFKGDPDFPLMREESFKGTESYKRLVDENDNITWISDDGPDELEDKMTLSRIDDDSYRFTFTRNSKPMDFGFKAKDGICVRIRNSGSNYIPFNCSFMKMYQRLQSIDPTYHQIHIEEYEYQKRIGKAF